MKIVFMKFRFESDDDLPFGKIYSIPIMILVIMIFWPKICFPNIIQKFIYMNVDMNYKAYAIIVQYTKYHLSYYFTVDEVDGYIEEKNGNKYLFSVSTDKNKQEH